MSGEASLLELDVQIEFADYVRFQYYDALRRLWWVLPLLFLGFALSGGLFLISAVRQDSYLLRDIVPFGSLIILGAVFFVSGPYLTSKRDFDTKPGLRQPIHYQVFETHLGIVHPKKPGKLPWTKIQSVHETGSAFLLYVQGSGAFILPKHEFASEADILSFRELLIVILGKRRCRIPPSAVASYF